MYCLLLHLSKSNGKLKGIIMGISMYGGVTKICRKKRPKPTKLRIEVCYVEIM